MNNQSIIGVHLEEVLKLRESLRLNKFIKESYSDQKAGTIAHISIKRLTNHITSCITWSIRNDGGRYK